MNKEELAALLNGRQYRTEMTAAEELLAKTAGLVVIFGYSDDNVELRGAVHDEVGAYEGTTVLLSRTGKVVQDFDDIDKDDEAEMEAYFKAKAAGFVKIEALFAPEGNDGPTWAYKTELPHATFEIMEYDELYCRGIVIAIADLA